VRAAAKTGQSSDPRCWWCGIKTEPETGYRGSAPELALPAGAGVIVCTPACPERPDGAQVWAAAARRAA
jgi:hypothetical protein